MKEKEQSPIIRLWKMGEGEQSKLIQAVILAVIGVTCGMLAYLSAAKIIIALIDGVSYFNYYLKCCLIAFAGYMIKAVLYSFALSKSHQAAFTIMKNIRVKFMKKLSKLPMGTLLDIPSGKMKQIIVDQVESMEVPLAHLIPEMTSNALVPILIMVYLFMIDWRMALISLISLPIGMIFMSFVMKDYGKKYEGSVKTLQNMNNTIVEYINGIEVIKAFNQGENYYYQWMKSCQLSMSAFTVISPSTLITVLPCGLLFAMNGSLSVSNFITIMILSLGIVGPLIAASNFIDNLARIATIVETLESLLNQEEQVHSNIPVEIKDTEIELKNVCFSYNGEEEILHNISLLIKPGTACAFVGPSGSGKSTITKLIAGFWDVKEGSITLGGHELKNIPIEQLNDQIAYVSQENYLFDETIRENIRMGNQNATDDEVEKVAKAAGCDEFIRKLDNGYETKAGGAGAHLSGGERQRISIARAMLKDAPIVILDEATAYIDPENEVIIQNAVANLVKGKTVIVIAHRLSTITGSDQIIVVNNGQVEATGTHDELLKECNLYKDMWEKHIGIEDGE